MEDLVDLIPDALQEFYDDLFRDSGYRPIHRVTDMPESVQDVLRIYLKRKIKGYDRKKQEQYRDNEGRLRPELLIANPDEPFNQSGCIKNPDLPDFRLNFAGQSDGVAFLFYKHRGFSPGSRVMIFELKHGKARRLYTSRDTSDPLQLMKDLVTKDPEELGLSPRVGQGQAAAP